MAAHRVTPACSCARSPGIGSSEIAALAPARPAVGWCLHGQPRVCGSGRSKGLPVWPRQRHGRRPWPCPPACGCARAALAGLPRRPFPRAPPDPSAGRFSRLPAECHAPERMKPPGMWRPWRLREAFAPSTLKLARRRKDDLMGVSISRCNRCRTPLSTPRSSIGHGRSASQKWPGLFAVFAPQPNRRPWSAATSARRLFSAFLTML